MPNLSLHGLHDRGGEHLMADRPGWVVVTEAIGADPGDSTGRDYRDLSDRGHTVIVRLNHGYGSTGTIPTPDKYGAFAQRVAKFIGASQGCTRWIVGNEPNHRQERPQGQAIAPGDYARCFDLCAQAVWQNKLLRKHEMILAAIAPWNVETGDWLDYFRQVCRETQHVADGVALHTYTHGADPALITSEQRMDAPFAARRFQFRSYRDFIDALPEGLWGKPIYITETNQDGPWLDQANGWVEAAYAEIDGWNRDATNYGRKIHALCLYRWSKDDQWHIDGKTGVQAGFRATVARGYTVPAQTANLPPTPAPVTHTVSLPNLQSGSSTIPDQSPKRIWDMRLSDRGVSIQTPVTPGPLWRVIMGRWEPEAEAGGRHHIYVDVLDEVGKRLAGVPLLVEWPGGSARIVTEAKSGEPYSGNYPMTASRNEFSIRVDDGTASETVSGIGMGANTPSGFNAGIHTNTILHFQRVAQAQPTPAPSPPVPENEPRMEVPPLVHPIREWALRDISQKFGENPAAYARFGLAGHNGVDFAVPMGTPIRAVDRGQVVEAGEDKDGYGLYVKLRHEWGETIYGHLYQLGIAKPLAPGMWLNAGDAVGFSGNTGNSTGPHLHFGMRVRPFTRGYPYDGCVDPLPYLPTDEVDVPHLIRQIAREFGIRTALFASLVWAESSFRPDARSDAGAQGLCQLMPSTWAEWSAQVEATDVWDARDNLRTGAAYWAWLRKTLGNDWSALIAWNFGIGNVLAKVAPPRETAQFANKVLHGADLLEQWLK